jgi:hypothetical protein
MFDRARMTFERLSGTVEGELSRPKQGRLERSQAEGTFAQSQCRQIARRIGGCGGLSLAIRPAASRQWKWRKLGIGRRCEVPTHRYFVFAANGHVIAARCVQFICHTNERERRDQTKHQPRPALRVRGQILISK